MSSFSITKRRLLQFTAGVAAGVVGLPREASSADDYPNKPIQLIVGFGAGGGVDVMARVLSQKMQESGYNSVVINRPGAGGNIATKLVTSSPPDGYTLLVTVSSLAINVSMYRNQNFDVERDLAPITLLSSAANIIAAHPSLGVKDLAGVVELARQRPGEITYASPGVGQASHLAMEMLSSMAKVKFNHIPFNGGGPSVAAAVGGQVNLLAGSLPTIIPAVQSGQLRALAVTTRKVTSLAPGVPTVGEAANLPDYDADLWYGLLAPAGTPRSIIDKLNAEARRILSQPEIQQRFAVLGFEPAYGTPEEFGKLIHSDIRKWSGVVKAANISLN